MFKSIMVMTRGLGNACTVMVGNKIGAGEEELAIEYANKYLIISAMLGLGLGIMLFFTSDLILGIFRNLTPELYHTSKKNYLRYLLYFSL